MKPHTGPGGEATKELLLDIVLAPKSMTGHAEVEAK